VQRAIQTAPAPLASLATPAQGTSFATINLRDLLRRDVTAVAGCDVQVGGAVGRRKIRSSEFCCGCADVVLMGTKGKHMVSACVQTFLALHGTSLCLLQMWEPNTIACSRRQATRWHWLHAPR
jgi:hypothetical protein